MIYKQVFILRAVLEMIQAEVKSARSTETGGALAGYLKPDNALVITHCCGPGPRGELRKSSVLIDGRYADRFCTKLFHDSRGLIDYVGDWHRHPTWSSLRASNQDLEAMLLIEQSNCCSVRYPLTAIYRSLPEKIVVYALHDRQLKPVKISWLDKIRE